MSSESTKTTKRRYELRKRADNMAATRQRITEAAVDLHGTVGPARTTVTAIAERAGVQRHTVYRHFPTDDDLFTACSGHFAVQHPWPDVRAWRPIADPAARLERGLDELYAYYERTEAMYTNILRDAEVMDVVADHLAPFGDALDGFAAALGSGWGVRGGRRQMLIGAARHAVDFRTWQSLARRGGLTRTQAVELAPARVKRAAGAAR